MKDLVAEMVNSEVERRLGVNQGRTAFEETYVAGPDEGEWDFDLPDDDAILSDYQVLEMVEEFEAEHGPLQDALPSVDDPASTPPTYETGTVAADLIATVRTDRDPDVEKKNSDGKEE